MRDLIRHYSDICQGFSKVNFKGGEIVFRHNSLFSNLEIEEERERSRVWAEGRGYKNKAKALEFAIKAGLWSEEQEILLKKKEESCRIMWARRGKLRSIDEIRPFHEQIREVRAEIDKDHVMRNHVTQNCSENYANLQGLNLEIRKSCSFFTEESFNELSAGDLMEIRELYSDSIFSISEDFFKKLTLSGMFYSLYENYASNPSAFFGKPAPELTLFQTSLLKYAKRSHHIVENSGGAPDDFYEDFDILETYVMIKNNKGVGEGEVDSREDMLEELNKISRR